MIVQCGNPNAALLQLLHHRIDLVLRQHEVAHDQYRLTVRLEGEPTAQCKTGLEVHAVERYVKIGSWQAHFVDVAAMVGAPSDRRLVRKGRCCPARRRLRRRWARRNPIRSISIRRASTRSLGQKAILITACSNTASLAKRKSKRAGCQRACRPRKAHPLRPTSNR